MSIIRYYYIIYNIERAFLGLVYYNNIIHLSYALQFSRARFLHGLFAGTSDFTRGLRPVDRARAAHCSVSPKGHAGLYGTALAVCPGIIIMRLRQTFRRRLARTQQRQQS